MFDDSAHKEIKTRENELACAGQLGTSARFGVHGQTDRQTDRQTDTDRDRDRQIQTETETDRETSSLFFSYLQWCSFPGPCSCLGPGDHCPRWSPLPGCLAGAHCCPRDLSTTELLPPMLRERRKILGCRCVWISRIGLRRNGAAAATGSHRPGRSPNYPNLHHLYQSKKTLLKIPNIFDRNAKTYLTILRCNPDHNPFA